MADEVRSPQPEAPASESRRHVAVLFTDLSDSTHLSAVMEAEIYAAMLDDVRDAFRLAVESRGGVVNQYQGDGLQALFGHEAATETDGLRAAEAALEVHARVKALRLSYSHEGSGSLSVHSGLHAGQALARPGESLAARVELYGPAPGIAKHLSDCAEADEILVSEETLGPMSELFNSGPLRSLRLKGRSEPLAVRRILSRNARRTRYEAHSQRGLVSFVGRELELQRLQAALDRAAGGAAPFVVISAPAGQGKTRLAEEFLHRAAADGTTVLRGFCDTELSAEPLLPVLQMLRALWQIAPEASAASVVHAVREGLQTLDADFAPLEAELLQAFSVASPAGGAAPLPAACVMKAVKTVLATLARRGPLLLFVDDWQWADEGTRQLLAALRQAAPVLLLATQRSSGLEELDAGGRERIDLAPLLEHEAAATVAERLPAADPFVMEKILRQAGGNPLFIEELCHFAARVEPSAAWSNAPGGPAWLETLIASRVARLPTEQRSLLDTAAVIGSLVPASLLERLTGCAIDHPSMVALAVQDLLFPAEEPGLLRFKHGITRDVVYGAIGLQARRAAHRQTAALLAEPGDAAAEAQACEALAYHCSGAGDPARAARCATLAGDKAMLASALDRAKAQYRAALEQMDRLPPSPEQYQAWRSVIRKLGMACVFDPARADLLWFERAVAEARAQEDRPGLAFASYWRAYVSYALGESRISVEHAEAALEAAEAAGDRRLGLQVRALQAQALGVRGDAPAALALLEGVLDHLVAATRPGERPLPALAFTIACGASVLGDCGRFDEAHADFGHALDVLPAAGHEVEASVRCLRSNVYLWQGRWHEAAEDAAAVQRIAERVRSLYLLGMGRSLAAWAQWKLAQGKPAIEAATALKALRDATAWLIARDKRLFISLNHGRLAEALMQSGDIAGSRQQGAEALKRWRGRDPFGAALALRTLAINAMAAGRPRLARRRLDWADRAADARHSAHEREANARCRSALGLS
jgi:class 3 adenylate cyclase/tetratricopeptide (TPR) repeat protein